MAGVPNLGFVVGFFSSTHARKDYAATTTNADGRRVPGAETTGTFRGHVFPTPGDTLARLGTGHEPGGSVEIHTQDTLNLASVEAGTRGTVITFRGKDYEVDTEGEREAEPGNVYSFGVYFAKLVRRATP